jgi:hypothetical protein
MKYFMKFNTNHVGTSKSKRSKKLNYAKLTNFLIIKLCFLYKFKEWMKIFIWIDYYFRSAFSFEFYFEF